MSVTVISYVHMSVLKAIFLTCCKVHLRFVQFLKNEFLLCRHYSLVLTLSSRLPLYLWSSDSVLALQDLYLWVCSIIDSHNTVITKNHFFTMTIFLFLDNASYYIDILLYFTGTPRFMQGLQRSLQH